MRGDCPAVSKARIAASRPMRRRSAESPAPSTLSARRADKRSAIRQFPWRPIARNFRRAMLCRLRRQLAECAALFRPTLANCRRGRLPTELFAHTRPDLLGAIARGDLDIPDVGLSQSFLLDRISGCRGTLIMPAALILHRGDRPAARVDNEDVYSLTVDRAKCILGRRCENFSEARLREDAIAPAVQRP